MDKKPAVVRTPLAIGLTAGALAVSAILTSRQSQRAEEQHPPTGRFISVDGARLHYFEQGSGPAVLLIHGSGVTAEDYIASGVFDQLSQRFRVVAFDRPGYGYSERPAGADWTAPAHADLLDRACNALGIERAIVVAHSWGTLVALEMALKYPERVLGLVLVSGLYYPAPRVDSLLLALPALPVLGTLMRHTISPLAGRLVVPRMVRRMFEPDPVPETFLTAVPLPMMLRPEQLRAAAEDAGRLVSTAVELHTRYAELQLPTIILAGAEDRIVNPDGQSTRLQADIPGSRIEIIPNAGHMLHYSNSGHIVEAVSVLSAPIPAEA